ncbi:unnamed protein product [Tilletia controversa]|uniref:Prolyl endopeptidase n=3 Tax=Tilletia TaxID=13289 RepID=A0A8X7MN68_9BASI|nr:hypothetical protein CF336_g6068 [Tilletia laevis]KAE8191071.1 hypothetical protein CF328_g5791 [Tilletia controversa]KAE8256462.1 hypothetical protein A4X03_0g5383 [Tilletia caries]KAE8194355.1 hypothetical protein CF335_g5365 [Tilletia laevis]KAE8242882.1 hypothetical protein A4X06_0g6705 [Tilletia controversa]
MAAISTSSARLASGWDPKTKPFPQARRTDDVETFKSAKAASGKVDVADPYKWLETPPSKSDETKDWVKAQADYAQDYISGYPDRAAFKKRVEANMSFPRFSCPSLKGDGAYYFNYNAGLDPQSTIYRATRQDIEAAEKAQHDGKPDAAKPPGSLWFDTNLLSKDGTIALGGMNFSKSGKHLAYSLSKNGSDWQTIYVRKTTEPFVKPEGAANPEQHINAEGGPNRLEDKLEFVKFSSIGFHNDVGIFYQRFPDTTSGGSKGTETDATKDAELYYHKIGTKQEDDILVIGKDPKCREIMWGGFLSEDKRWLQVNASKDTNPTARSYIACLDDQDVSGNLRWIPLAHTFDYQLGYLGNDVLEEKDEDGKSVERFYYMTNKDAPNYRVVYTDVRRSSARTIGHVSEFTGEDANLIELVPEQKDALLDSAEIVAGNRLLLTYKRNVQDELWEHELGSGKAVRRLLADLVGTIAQVSGRREDKEIFVSSISFTNPGVIHRITFDGDKKEAPKEVVHRTTKVAGIKPEDYISKQVWFDSTDGAKVPMFVTYPKSIDPTKAPVLLYAYGGFNISLPPSFSPGMMTWTTEYGGIYAVVNARGGGEFGESWWKAGTRFNKQHTFDDVLNAAKYLHGNGLGAKGKIVVNGGSNGGLTVAAVGNQAGEEHGIGALIAEVGVLDLLRFQRHTIGSAWVGDYLNADESGDQFDHLYSISPLENIVPNKAYPTYLLMSADHDDRVVPLHTFKFAAKLQHECPANPNPILLRVDINAGHGAGKSTAKRIDELCDKWSVIARALNLKLRDAPTASL